jgi:hypothetical protein
MALVTVFLIKTLAAISLAQSIKLAAVLRILQGNSPEIRFIDAC